jgi:uncharacterized membrane protein
MFATMGSIFVKPAMAEGESIFRAAITDKASKQLSDAIQKHQVCKLHPGGDKLPGF